MGQFTFKKLLILGITILLTGCATANEYVEENFR